MVVVKLLERKMKSRILFRKLWFGRKLGKAVVNAKKSFLTKSSNVVVYHFYSRSGKHPCKKFDFVILKKKFYNLLTLTSFHMQGTVQRGVKRRVMGAQGPIL